MPLGNCKAQLPIIHTPLLPEGKELLHTVPTELVLPYWALRKVSPPTYLDVYKPLLSLKQAAKQLYMYCLSFFYQGQLQNYCLLHFVPPFWTFTMIPLQLRNLWIIKPYRRNHILGIVFENVINFKPPCKHKLFILHNVNFKLCCQHKTFIETVHLAFADLYVTDIAIHIAK